MIRSARRHRLALGLAAAGSALALAACGADESVDAEDTAAEEAAVEDEEPEDTEEGSADDGEWNTGEIPDELPRLDDGDLPDEEPDNEAALSDKIAWEAFNDVADVGVIVDPGAAWECPDIEGDEGEEVTCTVTYFGEDFDYEVTMEGGGGFIVNYQAELSEGPIVREAAENAIRYSAETEEVRCDMGEVLRTPLDTDDVVQCEARDGDDTIDYSIGVNGYGTMSPSREM